jgi:hypothetical protein
VGKLRNIFSFIKFSHTIFALPFALASMLIASQGIPPLRIFLLILAFLLFPGRANQLEIHSSQPQIAMPRSLATTPQRHHPTLRPTANHQRMEGEATY